MKTSLVIWGALLALNAMAQTPEKVLENNPITDCYVPKKFSYDGKTRIVREAEQSDSEQKVYEVISPAWQVEKTIKVGNKDIEELRITNADEGIESNDGISPLTQTLFNADAKWEYLAKNGDHYELYDEDGKMLYAFSAKDGEPRRLVLFNGEWYLAFSYDGRENGEYVERTSLYRIQPSTPNAIQRIDNPALSRLVSNFVHRNEAVRIVLNPQDAQTAHTLLITDLSGKTIVQQQLAAGQREAVVDTHHFASGTYAFSLTVQGKKVESGKLVVR